MTKNFVPHFNGVIFTFWCYSIIQIIQSTLFFNDKMVPFGTLKLEHFGENPTDAPFSVAASTETYLVYMDQRIMHINEMDKH